MTAQRKLGDLKTSEALIKDLYVDLRRQVNAWAEITKQTAQARMGYIGQHLVSVVTGYPGGRSGARGHDLILPNGGHSEIKTCSRVDQLGICKSCKSPVASIELVCESCGSADVNRKKDSKWLIGIRTEDEFDAILDPQHYYLALFEFSASDPSTIDIRIWRVETAAPGFAYAMVDYYFNIRAHSKSKAAFNLWPDKLKFPMMRPVRVYHSQVSEAGGIKTLEFPTQQGSGLIDVNLRACTRASALTNDIIDGAAARLGAGPITAKKKSELLTALLDKVEKANAPADVADALAHAFYRPGVDKYFKQLPPKLKGRMKSAGLLS